MRVTERNFTDSEIISDIHQEPASRQLHVSWWDVLHHVGSQNWLTKKGRINSWLLQNLAAQPDEALYHRTYLEGWVPGDQLSVEEWARSVLKFWTVNDVASPFEYADCSTNGAIKSGCYYHSVRVTFDDKSIAEGETGVEHLSRPASESSEADMLEEGQPDHS
jgi:hypothetical protein